jgi:hypothetical protein
VSTVDDCVRKKPVKFRRDMIAGVPEIESGRPLQQNEAEVCDSTNPNVGRARAWLLLGDSKSQQGELQGATHPARATVTRAPGGMTLGPEQGELGAHFTALGSAAEQLPLHEELSVLHQSTNSIHPPTISQTLHQLTSHVSRHPHTT